MASSESLAATEECNSRESTISVVESDAAIAVIRPPLGNEPSLAMEEDQNAGTKRARDKESPAEAPVVAAAGAVTDEAVDEAPALKRVKTGADNLEPTHGEDNRKDDDRKMEEEEVETTTTTLGAEGTKEVQGGEQQMTNEDGRKTQEVKLGPKVFHSAVELFTYLYDFLHGWICNQDVNKYEFMVLSDLVGQGAPDKVECGIAAIQIRMHPTWHSRCFFVVHKDGTVDDFSYRKAADKLMPLPSSLYLSTGELDLDKLFPGHKQKNQHWQQGRVNGGRGNGARGVFHGGRGRGGYKGRQ
ncbi:unnamed protein product [Sphagnum balticum]